MLVSEEVKITGGCLCGAIRYEADHQPLVSALCHCRMCQKVHGAAFGTYCFVKAEQIRLTAGTDAIVNYESSSALVRSLLSAICFNAVLNSASTGWRLSPVR